MGPAKRNSNVIEIGLQAQEGSELIFRLLTVVVVYLLSLSDSVRAPKLDEGEPQILIVLDYYWSVVTGEIIKADSGPVAMYTKLGWVLSGPLDYDASANLITYVLRVDTGLTNKDLDQRLKSFWDLESLGIVDSEETVYEQLGSHISFYDGHYKLSLPWKDPCLSVSDTLSLSKRRLWSLLKRDPKLLKEYNQISS